MFFAMLAPVCLSHEMRSQTAVSGGLIGVVTDQSHAVVPNADVEIKDNSKGTIQSTRTDREGVYQFFLVLPSVYTLTVSHSGFRGESRAVNVLLGPPVTVNIALEIAKTSSEVTVTGEAPLIHAENGDVSATVNQKQISEVPNPGNDLTYIAQAAPGVVMNTDMQGLANFSTLGMPGTSNLFTVNGMNDNDNGINLNLVGSLNLLLGQNQVQEATIVISGYSGQFGGAGGANINYITKSGSTDFHGNAKYYWNGRALNANDWILNATGNPRPFDNANQWAASLGGPIVKEKVFFFLDTEGLKLLLPQVFFVALPSPQFETATLVNIDSRFGNTSPSDAFYKKIFNLYNSAPGAGAAMPGGFSVADPTGCTGFVGPKTPQGQLGVDLPCALKLLATRGLPSEDSLTSGRVDWNASTKDRAFLQIQYDRGQVPIAVDPISPFFDAVGDQPWWQGELIETHTFGSSAASQFLLGANYFAPIFRLAHPSQALTAFPATLNFAPGTFTTLARANSGLAFTAGRPTTQYQVSDDFVKTQGSQRFGFGASFERIYWTSYVNTPFEAGALTAQTLDAFYQGGVDPKFLDGTDPDPDYTQLGKSFSAAPSQRITFYTLGLYGEDEWHARPNWTLTFALRAEHQSDPWCPRGCFARMHGPFDSVSHDPNQPYKQAILIDQKQALPGMDKILWSPRFSFAWQPLGVSSNTVLRGGIGMFYDPVPGNLALTLSGNPPLLNSYTMFGDNLTPDEKTSLFKDAAGSNTAFLDGFATGQTLAQIQATIESLYPPGFTPPAISVSERRIHPSQYQRWSLELERAFSRSTSVNVGYFGHHGIHELVVNNSANAYCNPTVMTLPSGATNPCFGFVSSLPVAVPDARFSEVTDIASIAVSNYNGIVTSFRHRSSQGLLQANYTYGHAFDEVSNGGLFSFTTGSSLTPQEPSNLPGAYGQAEYDVRHSFNATYVWELPLKTALRAHGRQYLVNGWQVSGAIFARSGFPYTVFDFSESSNLAPSNNYFSAIYAVPVSVALASTSCGKGAAFPNPIQPCQPLQLLPDGVTPNLNAHFVQAGCETGFNSGKLPGSSGPCSGAAVTFAQGRNRFRGPNYFNTDFSVMKNTKFHGWDKGSLGLGVQFFNFFNHPNFGLPDNNVSDPLFGQILYMEQPATTILGAGRGGDASARMIQLKAQLQF